jgi:plasmid stability protein
MAILQIRDLPDDLYAHLRSAAARNHRSIAQQAIVDLRKAQGLESSRRHAALQRLREADGPPSDEWPDLEALVRVDRER